MKNQKAILGVFVVIALGLGALMVIYVVKRPLFLRMMGLSHEGSVAGINSSNFRPTKPNVTNAPVNTSVNSSSPTLNSEGTTPLERGVPIVATIDAPKAGEWTTEELQTLARTYSVVGNRRAKFTKEQITVMKAANSDLIVHRYTNIASGFNVVNDAFRNAHPELLLKTASGELHHGLVTKNNELIFDPGNETWRKIFIDDAIKAVTEDGHDGIMIDETAIVNRLFEPFTGINPRTNKPFTSEEWRDEVYEFLGEVKAALGSDKIIILNSVAYGEAYFDQGAERFLNVSTGFSAEGFKGPISWDTTRYPSESQWLKNVEMVTSVQEKGGTIVAVAKYDMALITSQEDLDAHALFTWLTFMLGKGDKSAYVYNEYDKKDPFGAELPYPWYWNVNYGAPVGTYTKDGGVYLREFERAKILVNPGTTAQEVQLGGTYTTLDGTSVTSVTMQPHRGFIVLKP
ncbi:MAG: hypothetical protein HYV34_01810 [Candidatus Kerfeldbacteria bacterium]|nr:hypothetical protein [Candidatus Kerfeldbacteria bacterium]